MNMNIKYQICVVTGTRADYGLLRKLLLRLKNYLDVKLTLVVTGSHLSGDFGNTQKEIIEDGFSDFVKIPLDITDDSREGMAISTGDALIKFAKFFTSYKPDILVVLGDRYEIFSAVSAAYLIGIPVAHISGGDITEGAVDNAIRHCLTKMSCIHFPGCEQSRKRIIQMGEQPDLVFNVGEPGVENCLSMKLLTKQELSESLKFNIIDYDYSVVTFHPVTLEYDKSIAQTYELIRAMDSQKNMNYIITMSNADAGGRAINTVWLQEEKKRNNWLVVSSLGVLRYLSAIKFAKMVIGNSSSGIVEAPSIGVPTVNIGNRQKGRMMAESVISCNPIEEDIVKAMRIALTEEFQKKSKKVYSPFGDGTTSYKIAKIITEYLSDNRIINEKQFYDIDFSY